jgi:hypothetical protein
VTYQGFQNCEGFPDGAIYMGAWVFLIVRSPAVINVPVVVEPSARWPGFTSFVARLAGETVLIWSKACDAPMLISSSAYWASEQTSQLHLPDRNDTDRILRGKMECKL